jgi:hypothetical protein
MKLVRDLQLCNMDFKVDSKTIVDNIYEKQISVSVFSEITGKCVYLLCTDLLISNVYRMEIYIDLNESNTHNRERKLNGALFRFFSFSFTSTTGTTLLLYHLLFSHSDFSFNSHYFRHLSFMNYF